jgi:hypothetical protein
VDASSHPPIVWARYPAKEELLGGIGLQWHRKQVQMTSTTIQVLDDTGTVGIESNPEW